MGVGVGHAGFDMFRGLGGFTDAIERTVLEGLRRPGRGDSLRDLRLSAHEWGDRRRETLAGFTLGAATIKDATTAYRVADGQLSLAKADWVSPITLIEPPASEAAAALLLPSYLAYPLAHFPPKITVDAVDEHGHALGQELKWADVTPLYAICMLELFNHIVEEARYRICPVCERPFVRHQGRSDLGQHRLLGVKFCSVECNRINAQREYRRRARTGGKT